MGKMFHEQANMYFCETTVEKAGFGKYDCSPYTDHRILIYGILSSEGWPAGPCDLSTGPAARRQLRLRTDI